LPQTDPPVPDQAGADARALVGTRELDVAQARVVARDQQSADRRVEVVVVDRHRRPSSRSHASRQSSITA